MFLKVHLLIQPPRGFSETKASNWRQLHNISNDLLSPSFLDFFFFPHVGYPFATKIIVPKVFLHCVEAIHAHHFNNRGADLLRTSLTHLVSGGFKQGGKNDGCSIQEPRKKTEHHEMDMGWADLNNIWVWGQQEDVLIFTVFSPPSGYHQMGLLPVCKVTPSSSSFSAPSDTLHCNWSLSFKATFNVGIPSRQGPYIYIYVKYIKYIK